MASTTFRHTRPLATALLALTVMACGGSTSEPTPPPPTYAVRGTVGGLYSGNQVTVRLNGASPLVVSADGSFAFPTRLTSGSAYAVTVSVQPTTPGQTCTVANGSGTVAGQDVANVGVTCVVDPSLIDDFRTCDDQIEPVDGRSGTWVFTTGYAFSSGSWSLGGTPCVAGIQIEGLSDNGEYMKVSVVPSAGATWDLRAYQGFSLRVGAGGNARVEVGTCQWSLPASSPDVITYLDFGPACVPSAVSSIDFWVFDNPGGSIGIHEIGLYH
jgi:hypothetical protein